MDTDIVKLLEESGFTRKEARVYLALLELGDGTVTRIAKKSDLKRSIIYVVLEGLIKRGYVQALPNRKIETYRALDPTIILSRLKLTTQNLTEMLPFLRTLGNVGTDKPKITYYDKPEDLVRLYREFTFVNSEFENIFIASYSRMEEFMPGILDEWLKYYPKKKHRSGERHLIPDIKEDIAIGRKIAQNLNQEVRTLDALNGTRMDFSILENKLVITSFEKHPFIVIIESQGLIDSMRPIFEIAWQQAERITPGPCQNRASVLG